MPNLADMYEPEHLDAARELCESIHDEAGPGIRVQARRGTQVPCRACLAETASDTWTAGGPWWGPSDPWAAVA